MFVDYVCVLAEICFKCVDFSLSYVLDLGSCNLAVCVVDDVELLASVVRPEYPCFKCVWTVDSWSIFWNLGLAGRLCKCC
jgi:hypothetical protein